MILEIKNLTVSYGDKTLIQNINLCVNESSRHLLTGHNGSGKSTLAQAIVGNPEYNIVSGEIKFMENDITRENATRRSLLGIFMGGQNVPEIPGLTVISFLKHSAAAHKHFQTGRDLSMAEFMEKLEIACEKCGIPKEWLSRSINVGFSGGERKKIMLLRLLMTQPKLAILDEPDAGADMDVQKLIADTVLSMTDTTFLIISHQDKFKDMINADHITALSNGENVI